MVITVNVKVNPVLNASNADLKRKPKTESNFTATFHFTLPLPPPFPSLLPTPALGHSMYPKVYLVILGSDNRKFVWTIEFWAHIMHCVVSSCPCGGV